MFWCKLGLFPALKKSLFGELSHTVLSCPIKMRSVLTVCVFCTVSSKEVAILKTKFTYQGPSHRSPPPTLPRSPLTRLLLWGAADAEIKGHSFEKPEQTTVLLLKPGVTRSEHSHSCFAHCHECLVLSSTFSRLFFIFKFFFFLFVQVRGQCCFTFTETYGLLETGVPGRPPRLSHSSRALKNKNKTKTPGQFPVLAYGIKWATLLMNDTAERSRFPC